MGKGGGVERGGLAGERWGTRKPGVGCGGREERRPNRSWEGGWLKGGAGRSRGGFRTGSLTAAAGRREGRSRPPRSDAGDPSVFGAPGSKPWFLPPPPPPGDRVPLQLHTPLQPQGSPDPCRAISLGEGHRVTARSKPSGEGRRSAYRGPGSLSPEY